MDDEILKVTAVDGATVTVARAQAGRPAAQHEAGSVVYALSPLLVDNLPTYGAATERVVGKIAQSLKDLRDGLGAHANQVTFIPMPVLFEKPLNMNGYSAVTANVVNGVLFANGPFLYPSTGSGAFHNYILTKLPAAIAYEHHWEFLHCAPEGGGGLHCATAARRELKPEKAWWEMLNDWE